MVVLSTGMALVFFYMILMIPFAVIHKRLERRRAKRISTKPLPSLSIIVPAHNEEGYIGRCIDALLEADYPSDRKEIIVVDDGSTDGTLQEMKRYEKRGVKVFHKKHGGKYSALNYGLMFAKGDIVVTVDADSLIARRALKFMVERFQNDPEIGGVAGNVKVLNRGSFITGCQALEYIVNINIFRRALDLFGSVMVVPGSLGAYRKKSLERGGFYDPDTLVEDFDTTVKTLKLGKTVQASSGAQVFTEVPSSWRDLYRQRLRWYGGIFQTLLKHRDAFMVSRFGFLHKLIFPFLVSSLTLLPVAGILVLASIVIGVFKGLLVDILAVFLFFNLLMMLISILAIEIDDEDWKLVIYAPFFVVGYKHFLDFIKIKALMDVIRGKGVPWVSPRRVARVKTPVR